MVNLYVHRINAGKMTIEDEPARWYDAVKAELEKDE